MQDTIQLFLSENVLLVMAAWWIFSNAVENMPSPVEASGTGYRWLYGFLNGLAGNKREAISQRGWGPENP